MKMVVQYYNFAAGSFHTFKKRNFVADFIHLKLTFIPSEKAFLATLSGHMGIVCTPSIARWKACGQLYIRHN